MAVLSGKHVDTPLFHVGCGRQLFTLEQARKSTMAVACVCGANSPVVTPDCNDPSVERAVALPHSLVLALSRGRFDPPPGPHLETYLGFSNFQCPAKAEWDRVLRAALGLMSMSECPERGCIDAIARQASRQRLR